MKVQIILSRLGYLASYVCSLGVVSAVYTASILSISISLTGALIPKIIGDKNRLQFITGCFRSIRILPVKGVLKDFNRILREERNRERKEVINVLRGFDRGDDIILGSEKIRSLQKKFYRELFKEWFTIECSEGELDVLARHSNPVNIGQDILALAGVSRKKVFIREDMDRIEFAYRTYIKILQVYFTFRRQNGEAERMFKAAKIKNLYPEEVTLSRLRMGKNRVFLAAGHTLQKIKMETEFIRFSNYVSLQTLQVAE